MNVEKILTPRQLEIYNLLATGSTRLEIAEHLGIERASVTKEISRYRKRLKLQQETVERSYADQVLIQGLKEEVAHFKKLYTQGIKTSVFQTKLEGTLSDIITARKIPQDYLVEVPSANTQEELIVCLSDFHGGELVKREAMLNINAYCIEIFEERMNNLYNIVLETIKTKGVFKKLHVFGLGDLISNSPMMHKELLASGVNVTEQSIIVAEYLSELLCKLSPHFETIEFTGVAGNHGRADSQRQYKDAYSGFDYLAMFMAKLMCANFENISFDLPRCAFAQKEICGRNFMIYHGTEIKQGSIKKSDSSLTETISFHQQKHIHYLVLGHFHTALTKEKIGGHIVVCGSMKGAGEYGLGRLLTISSATQKILIVEPEKGITWFSDADVS